jgi:hypothetical protein
LHVLSCSILCTAYVVGRALQVMHESGMMLAHGTLKFQMESTILLMVDFHHAKSFSFHTKVSVIILLSGVVPMSGMNSILVSSYIKHNHVCILKASECKGII